MSLTYSIQSPEIFPDLGRCSVHHLRREISPFGQLAIMVNNAMGKVAASHLKLDRRAAESFAETMLPNDFFRAAFPALPLANKINLIIQFLLGPQTERFAAEPVYGPTGKGELRSLGAEGITSESSLLSQLQSPSGKKMVADFARLVVQHLNAR